MTAPLRVAAASKPSLLPASTRAASAMRVARIVRLPPIRTSCAVTAWMALAALVESPPDGPGTPTASHDRRTQAQARLLQPETSWTGSLRGEGCNDGLGSGAMRRADPFGGLHIMSDPCAIQGAARVALARSKGYRLFANPRSSGSRQSRRVPLTRGRFRDGMRHFASAAPRVCASATALEVARFGPEVFRPYHRRCAD